MGRARAPSREQDAARATWIIGGIAVATLILAGSAFVLSRPADVPLQTVRPAPSGALVWHVEGRVTDTQLKPIEGACVAVGPNGCQPTNPRTDANGNWFIDFPQVAVPYDLHVTRQGYRQVDYRLDLKGPQRLDLAMEPVRP
jgi:Carboxypeptidase regulatory-like domain